LTCGPEVPFEALVAHTGRLREISGFTTPGTGAVAVPADTQADGAGAAVGAGVGVGVDVGVGAGEAGVVGVGAAALGEAALEPPPPQPDSTAAQNSSARDPGRRGAATAGSGVGRWPGGKRLVMSFDSMERRRPEGPAERSGPQHPAGRGA
jgi:hypothetical protein